VDDEDIVLLTMNQILQSLGYRTLTAGNGMEALEIYRNNCHAIDLVLLDMIMPELNGEETFREMKKINDQVKAIISSGYMQDYGMDALSELGVIDILQKPFRKQDLASKVANAIRQKTPPV
jgi:DNA-binding NtrC family response regulator